MLQDVVFALIVRLLASRWVRDYHEHNGRCEDTNSARLGPLHLVANYCFVLDHADTGVTLRLPLPRRQVEVGFTACQGTEPIRRPCWFWRTAPPH